MKTVFMRAVGLCASVLLVSAIHSQDKFKLKYSNSLVYGGIEIGSKGVKMSLLELGQNAQSSGSFNVLKDTSVNTDFITFNTPTFHATLEGVSALYDVAKNKYKIPTERIFTVISSGVQMQAEKDQKVKWIGNLVDSFRIKVKEPKRLVDIVDVREEGRLSHLGIVPESKRYNTFLIDIGSGNTKGGYFPYGNTKDFKLFQLNWGTKSIANAAEKRCDEFDKTLTNYDKQLYRVLQAAEDQDIIYAVNASGAYRMTDYIAFSGGIAWAVATLIDPSHINSSVVTVTYDDVIKFSETILKNHGSLLEAQLVKSIKDQSINTKDASAEIKRVHKVFDQRSLMAGTGLLLKVMRQFKSVYETKQFYLIKNGQVGWISAYVDQKN